MFKIDSKPGARPVGPQFPSFWGEDAVEEHVFDPHMIVEIFEMAKAFYSAKSMG